LSEYPSPPKDEFSLKAASLNQAALVEYNEKHPDSPYVPPGASTWPGGEVELPRFFILDEHEFPDDKTGKRVKLTKERLEKIAARCNARGRELDSLVPIIPGHTIDDAPETDQPPIVGYAVNFAVEPFFNTGRYAIACTPLAKSADHVKYFKAMPRRSVELWLDPDDIDPIAILGATTPRRDLGMHRFARLHRFSRESSGSLSPYSYVLPEPTPTMTDLNSIPPGGPSSGGPVDPSLVKAVAAEVFQHPLFKQFEEAWPLIMSLVSEKANAGEPGEGDDLLDPGESRGDEPAEGDDEPEPDEGDGDSFDDEDDEDEDEPEEEPKPNKKNASHCGPNNTSLPGSNKMSRRTPADEFRDEAIVAWYAQKYGHAWTPPAERTNQPAKLSAKSTKLDKLTADATKEKKKDQERGERVKFQKALDAANKKIAELEEKNLVGDVVKALTELDELEIPYNPEREIKRLVKMSREEWPAEIAYIKQIATGTKPQPPVNPVSPESQASVKFSRDGGAKAEDLSTGPKTAEEAYELANKISRGQLTQAEVFNSLQSRHDVRITATPAGPMVQVR
jgi:hypothetical protein